MTDCLAHPKYSFYIECLLLVAFVNVFCVEDCERVHKSVRSFAASGNLSSLACLELKALKVIHKPQLYSHSGFL